MSTRVSPSALCSALPPASAAFTANLTFFASIRLDALPPDPLSLHYVHGSALPAFPHAATTPTVRGAALSPDRAPTHLRTRPTAVRL